MNHYEVDKLIGQLVRAPESLFLEDRAVDLMRQAANTLRDMQQAAGRPMTRDVPFNTLCLGARFRYLNDRSTSIWVKVGSDTIAKWDAAQVADTWLGQTVCSFSDDGNLAAVVRLLD